MLFRDFVANQVAGVVLPSCVTMVMFGGRWRLKNGLVANEAKTVSSVGGFVLSFYVETGKITVQQCFSLPSPNDRSSSISASTELSL